MVRHLPAAPLGRRPGPQRSLPAHEWHTSRRRAPPPPGAAPGPRRWKPASTQGETWRHRGGGELCRHIEDGFIAAEYICPHKCTAQLLTGGGVFIVRSKYTSIHLFVLGGIKGSQPLIPHPTNTCHLTQPSFLRLSPVPRGVSPPRYPCCAAGLRLRLGSRRRRKSQRVRRPRDAAKARAARERPISPQTHREAPCCQTSGGSRVRVGVGDRVLTGV